MPHTRPIWLKKSRRRTLKSIERYVTPDIIYKMIIKGNPWPYKTNVEFYNKRDQALVCLIYLTCGRINEVLRLEKTQFSFKVPDFVVIKDYEISKRKKKTIQSEGIPKIDYPLPLTGTFSKFTQIFLEYFQVAPNHLFNISRQRAWAITNHLTGKWNHYFRSQRLSYLVNLFRSALITSKIVGVKNPQTLSHYYKTAWEEHSEELKL